jgi:hypothetical protein
MVVSCERDNKAQLRESLLLKKGHASWNQSSLRQLELSQ